MFVEEAGELFLRFPGLELVLFFSGGLPTFLLGSSPVLGAARFFVVLPPVDCFGVSFKVLVTAGIVTSICFAISDTRAVVDGCAISCNCVATVLGNISGPRTVDDDGLGEVSTAGAIKLGLLL